MRLRPLNQLDDKWSAFSNEYLVGDDGYLYRLKSDGRFLRLKSGGYRGRKQYGYQQVRGRFGTDKQHTVKVHRAVALAFIPKPLNANDVDHINNDKQDNRVENLQWLTHRENICKRYRQQMQGTGFFTMCIGGMFGDSQNLILPIVLMCIGTILLLTGRDEM